MTYKKWLREKIKEYEAEADQDNIGLRQYYLGKIMGLHDALIEYVKKEMVQNPQGKSEECPVLHFKEKALKPLVLNVTNSKQIERLYGSPYIEDWDGKKIQLYIARVNAFGEEVDAVRIRPQAPKTERENLTPSHPKWDAAKENLAKGNATLKAIKKHFNLSKENEELLNA